MGAVKKWDGASFVKSWISLLVNALELVTGRNGHAASNILKGNYEVCGFSVSENLAHRKHEKKNQNQLLSIVLYFVLQTAEAGARNVSISTSSLLVQNCLVNFDEDWGKKKSVCVCMAMYNIPPPHSHTHVWTKKNWVNGNDGKNTFSHTGTDKNYYCGVIVIQITTPKIVFHIYFVVTGVKRSAVLKTFYLTLFTRVSVLHAMLWTRPTSCKVW